MKINLFKVLLYTFLVSSVVTSIAYFILLLMFNDDLFTGKHNDEFFLISIAELSGIAFFSILYMVSFFLPLFYIQKKQIAEHKPEELFGRFMPLVSLIASFFAFLVLLIGEPYNGIESIVWINFWLFYLLSYSGLAAFVYLVKNNKR
ncbi:MAG: hypothetical protein PHR81_01315 [Bacteroidales bacterium]|nr:hypothetical protein [Bacteroidales bacterium]MDD4213427.1 hypothetical protein [Bacteroidales bacterium]